MNTKKVALILIITVFSIQPVFGMYHQKMGRFMQQDPLGIRPNLRISPNFRLLHHPWIQFSDGLNILNYGLVNPVTNLDAFGLDSPGCDLPLGDMGNHCWRRCCAKHDECYHNGGDPPDFWGRPCTSDSWGCGGRPECDKCNEDVMDCFARGAICDWSNTNMDYYGVIPGSSPPRYGYWGYDQNGNLVEGPPTNSQQDLGSDSIFDIFF